jgi:hypothetical protein
LINTDSGHVAKETDLFFGIDHSRLFLALQHKLLCVLKAILLEAKVLVQSSASACSLERSMISECSTCSTVKCFWHSLDALDLQLRWASLSFVQEGLRISSQRHPTQVISESPEQCSRAVLALLSLLPGGLWLGFNSDGFGERHFQPLGLKNGRVVQLCILTSGRFAILQHL